MDINNNQQVNSFLKGMNTDTSDSMIPAEQYRYAENLRIVTNTQENSGELRLIEGNRLLSTPEEGAEIMYLTSIRNYVVVVTRNNNQWKILASKDEGSTWTTIFGPCSEVIWDETTGKYALSGVTRWEADNNVKLYLTDNTGKHNMFLLNIDYEHWPSTVPTDIKMISGYINSSLKAPEISISEAYGKLKPARVQYAYRLYRYGGAATQLSALSNIISLYKSDTEGYQYGESAARAIDVKMYTANDLNLTRLQLYRITYEQMGQEPSCALVKDTAIETTQEYTQITDTGVDINTMSVSEFMALDTLSIKPKIIESKQDYLFAANVKYETDDVDEMFKDIDMRSFSSGMHWKQVGHTNVEPIDLNDLVKDDTYELVHDQFDESGDSEYNPAYWYKLGTTETGGKGPHIDWTYNTEWITVAPHLALNKKDQTRRFRHDETYRFGAILYDKYGRKSSVKWIADIRIPSFTKDDIQIQWLFKNEQGQLQPGSFTGKPDGEQYSIKQYSIRFSVHDMPADVYAVQIVRCQRGVNDTRVISQGMVGKPMQLYDMNNVSSSIIPDIALFINYGMYNDTSQELMIKTKTNKICPSGWMTMQHITAWNEIYDTIDRLKMAIPSEDIVMFASPEYVYAEDTVKDIIKSYQDSIKLKHAFVYDVFSTCVTGNDNYLGAQTGDHRTIFFQKVDNSVSYRSDIRVLSWVYERMGFRVSDATLQNKNCRFAVITAREMGDGTHFETSGVLNRKLDGSAGLIFNHDDKDGYIFFNHTLPSEIMDGERAQNAVANYGNNIKKYAFPKVPDWNSFAQEEAIRYQDDITVIANETYTAWSFPLALNEKTGKTSELADVFKDKDIDDSNCQNHHQATYYYPLGTGGKCILFKLGSKVTFGPNNATSYYHVPAHNTSGDNDIPSGHIFPLHIANLVKPVTPYKGYNKKAIEDSVYYQYGDYSVINGDIDIVAKQGDCTAMMFTYNNNHNWYDPIYVSASKMGTVCQIPIETDIDLRAANGDTLDQNTEWGYYTQDKASSFDGYSQQRDAYLYNTAYSSDPSIMPQTQAVYTDISDNDFDTRVHFSNVKTNGEHVDSWTRFKAANFTDVDTRYGQITDMRLFKERLVFWQISGMGTLRSNDRSVLQDVDNTQLVLGTGGVLDGCDYLSVVYGMKPDQFADGQSNTHLYWWDGTAKEICQLGQEVVPLSIAKNVSNYIHKNAEVSKPNVAYDNKYKELLFTVVNNETIAYNEFIAQFTSIYKYMPIFDTQVFDNLITTNKTSLFREDKKKEKGQAHLFNKAIYPLVQYVVNKDAQYNKVFDISTFGGRFYGGDEGIKHLRFTFNTPLKQRSTDKGEHLITNREYDFRLCIPRNNNSDWGDRMRGKTMQCELKSSSNSTDFSLQYIITKYRMSWS